MRKQYEKPRLCYESFQLAQSIASGCEGIANLAENQCSVRIPELGINIYLNNQICEFYPPNPDDSICYHAPSDNYNVFSS